MDVDHLEDLGAVRRERMRGFGWRYDDITGGRLDGLVSELKARVSGLDYERLRVRVTVEARALALAHVHDEERTL